MKVPLSFSSPRWNHCSPFAVSPFRSLLTHLNTNIHTVFLHKCDQIIHVILRFAFVLNNILVCIPFIQKIFTKGLGTRLTRRISALMILVILAVAFPPTSTSSFSAAAWCYNLYSQPLALHTELVSICSSINNTAADTPCSSPWVIVLGTGREKRLSNQSSQEARKTHISWPKFSTRHWCWQRALPSPNRLYLSGAVHNEFWTWNSNLHSSSVSY